METLVATVLIVIVFMVASMVLNNLFAGSVVKNDDQIKQELLQLQYQYEYGKLEIPHYEEIGPWDIAVTKEVWNASNQVVFSAVHAENKQEITFKMPDE